jgi:glycosyltransferase involved in cell wall biosynthesis
VTSAELSVIIPTYNRERLLDRALCSVLSQTVRPREIIVVDDGSADATKNLVSGFKNRTEVAIHYFRQVNNGPASARNRGIELASFPVLAFLDSDDHWHRKKIEIQYQQFVRSSQHRISHTGEKWLRRGKHLNQKDIHKPADGHIYESCLRLCCVGMSTVMMNRSLCDDHDLFDEYLRCCEDYDYWLRISASEKFLLIDAPLTIKEGGREDQVSVRYRIGMDRYRIYALVKLLVHGNITTEQQILARDMLVKKCEIYGTGCCKHGRNDEGEIVLALAENAYKRLTDEHLETIKELVRPVPLSEKNLH